MGAKKKQAAPAGSLDDDGKKKRAPRTKKATTTTAGEAKVTRSSAKPSPASEDLEWTEDLTWKLHTTITETQSIKRGLFPPPGSNASTKDGGGKNKGDHYMAIAKELFGQDDSPYKTAFDAAMASSLKAEKEVWATKVKNKINKLNTATRKHMETLGQTGEGIRSEKDVDLSQDNVFVNKFQAIIKDFPYFFHWRELIGSRPNVKPVGLGHSGTEPDMSVLGAGEVDPDVSTTSEVGGDASIEGDGEDAANDEEGGGLDVEKPTESVAESDAMDDEYHISSDEEEFPNTVAGIAATTKKKKADPPTNAKGTKKTEKRKRSDSNSDARDKQVNGTELNKGAAAQPSNQASARATIPTKKAKPLDAVMDVAIEEEKTKQAQFSLAQSQNALEVEKVKSDAKVKGEMIRYKLEISKQKAEERKMKIQLKMKKYEIKQQALQAAAQSRHSQVFPTPSFPQEHFERRTPGSSTTPTDFSSPLTHSIPVPFGMSSGGSKMSGFHLGHPPMSGSTGFEVENSVGMDFGGDEGGLGLN